jgi:hypothetical protein
MKGKLFIIFFKFMRFLLKNKYIKARTFFLVVGKIGVELANTPEQLKVMKKFIEGGNRIIGKTQSN